MTSHPEPINDPAQPPGQRREPAGPATGWQRTRQAVVRGFHAYANWLVGISWRRFFLLSLLLLIAVAIVHDLPPFTWTVTERVETPDQDRREPLVKVERPKPGESGKEVEIRIDERGIRITPRSPPASAPASPPPAAASTASPTSPSAAGPAVSASDAARRAASAVEGVTITLPPGVVSDSVREAIAEAKREIERAVEEARREADEARAEAEQARAEVRAAPGARPTVRITHYGVGDGLMQLTLFWIVASIILKITYKGRIQAEAKAAAATETAEAEALRRQVVEARMSAMQAQIEPHFLFNTLASIDHLIETDPPRASRMQRHLIALLRATMPALREAGTNGRVRTLGDELGVIEPYLEILKVRMEDRLATQIDVPEGLRSAEFPAMMVQTLVENAIKHGLEPKAEGGSLSVNAQIAHGSLVVRVADTGLGFAAAPTAGTGVGLANLRERLQLLYGDRAHLQVAPNTPEGTVVTVTLPYRSIEPAVR